jgi:hypothetical protein
MAAATYILRDGADAMAVSRSRTRQSRRQSPYGGRDLADQLVHALRHARA